MEKRVGAGRARPPPPGDRPRSARGDPILGRRCLMWNDDVEISICSPTGRPRSSTATASATSASSSRGLGHARDDVRPRCLSRARLRRDSARHDLPLQLGEGPHTWLSFSPRARSRCRAATRTATASCSRPRRSGTVTSTPRRSSTRTTSAATSSSSSGSAAATSATWARLPPLRRRRLGRLRVPVHVQRPRLRAAYRPRPAAAAGPPDVPGAELRHLLVLPARARLRPARGADPVQPLEPAVRGGDLLRHGRVRQPRRGSSRVDHGPPVRAAARPPARPRREVARRAADRGARGHVGHLPPAEADRARPRARRPRPTPTHGATRHRRRSPSRRPAEEGRRCSRRRSSTRR